MESPSLSSRFFKSLVSPLFSVGSSKLDHEDEEMCALLSLKVWDGNEETTEPVVFKAKEQHQFKKGSREAPLARRIYEGVGAAFDFLFQSEKRFSAKVIIGESAHSLIGVATVRDAVALAFPNALVAVSEKGGRIGVDLDGVRVGIKQLEQLIAREEMFVGSDEAQQRSLEELAVLLEKMASHQSRKERFFNTTVGQILWRVGVYLIGTEKRISVQEWSGAKHPTIEKLQTLVSTVFKAEIDVGQPRTSLAGKPSIVVSYKKSRESLSKRELSALTDQMIDDLKVALVRFDQQQGNRPDVEKERGVLVERLRDAEQLQLLLRQKGGARGNLVEYLSLKQEAFLGLARAICLPAFCVVKVGMLVKQGWKELKTWRLTRQLIEKMQIAESEKLSAWHIEQLKVVVRAASQLPQLLQRDEEGFIKAYHSLTDTDRKKAIVEAYFRTHRSLLKSAVRGKESKVLQFVIENALFKSVNTTILETLFLNPAFSQQEKERFVGELFRHAPDFKSREKIINYLVSNQESGLAEALVDRLLVQTQNEGATSDRMGALLLAARLSSSALLQKAFGAGAESVEEFSMRVKPYIFLPYEEGRSLLSYAIQGGNADFILGVDKAMRDLYLEKRGGSDHAYREEKRASLQAFISGLENVSVSLEKSSASTAYSRKPPCKKEVIQEHLLLLEEEHPELHYLYQCQDSPATLLRHLRRELLNLDRSGFHARDARGVMHLSRLDLGTADAMDEWLAEKMGSGTVVDCFRSAVLRQKELFSTRSAFVHGMGVLGFFAASCCVASLPFKISVGMAAGFNFLNLNIPAAGAMGMEMGRRLQSVWWEEMSADRHFSKNLTQYLEKFPLDGTEGKEVESDTPKAVASRKAVQEGKMVQTADLQKGVEFNLKHNRAGEALHLLQRIVCLPEQEKAQIKWEPILAAYADLTLYSKQERIEIFSLLFQLVATRDQMVDLIDMQLTLGRRGGEIIEQVVRGKIAEWKKRSLMVAVDRDELDQKMYEGAMVIAAKLGDYELFNDLMEFETLKEQLDWQGAGGTRTSLLHAAMSSKLSASNVEAGKLLRAIYKQMVLTNQDPNFSPFKLLRGGSTWYNRWLKDRTVLELATIRRAAAFDAELALDPNLSGTVTHAVMQRVQKSLLPVELGRLLDLTIGPLLLYAAAKSAHLLPYLLGLGGGTMGPAGVFFCQVAAVMVIEIGVFLISFTTSTRLGRNFSEAYHDAVETWQGNRELAQLGERPRERVTAMHKKEMTRVDAEKLAQLELTAFEYVQEGMLKGIEDVRHAYSSDDKMVAKIDLLYRDVQSAMDIDSIKRAFMQIDVTETVKFLLLGRLMTIFEKPLSHFPHASDLTDQPLHNPSV